MLTPVRRSADLGKPARACSVCLEMHVLHALMLHLHEACAGHDCTHMLGPWSTDMYAHRRPACMPSGRAAGPLNEARLQFDMRTQGIVAPRLKLRRQTRYPLPRLMAAVGLLWPRLWSGSWGFRTRVQILTYRPGHAGHGAANTA